MKKEARHKRILNHIIPTPMSKLRLAMISSEFRSPGESVDHKRIIKVHDKLSRTKMLNPRSRIVSQNARKTTGSEFVSLDATLSPLADRTEDNYKNYSGDPLLFD